MLKHVQLRWRWPIVGMVLFILLGGGLYAGLPTLHRVTATRVTIDALVVAPERYIDQPVEVQGKYGFIGMDECQPGTLALLSLNQPNRYIYLQTSVPLDRKSSRPVIVWGRLRRYNSSACGSFGAIYIDAESIEFLDPTPMK